MSAEYSWELTRAEKAGEKKGKDVWARTSILLFPNLFYILQGLKSLQVTGITVKCIFLGAHFKHRGQLSGSALGDELTPDAGYFSRLLQPSSGGSCFACVLLNCL